MEGKVITLKEVAEFLKVHERTVYRLAAKGEIPAFKVANSWRFRREDIERWIDQKMHSATPRGSHEADR